MNSFASFLIYTLLVVAFFLFLTFFADFFKNKIIQRKEEREKGVPYESGVPFKQLEEVKVDIRFFKIALIFLLFDVEVVYLFPWAYRLEKIGLFALIEGIIFIFVLMLAYIYILKGKGVE